MSKFKIGDQVVSRIRSEIGEILESIQCYVVRWPGDSGAGVLCAESTLDPAPEPEITDAERVAAACHKKFCGLDELGCGWHFVESSQGSQNSGKFRTQLEALDAWVRHLRSIGWKYQEGK